MRNISKVKLDKVSSRKSGFGNPRKECQVHRLKRATDPPTPEMAPASAKTCSNCQFAWIERSTRHTQLLCSRAAIMLSVPDDESISALTTRGKAGQMSSSSLAGVSGAQKKSQIQATW